MNHRTHFQFVIILLGLFLSIGMGAQNLVPNGSFEEITDCENAGQGFIWLAEPWFSPSEGTPDNPLRRICNPAESLIIGAYILVPSNHKTRSQTYY